MEKKNMLIGFYEYVPILNGNRELEESLEYKEAKKPYRAIPLVQALKHVCSNIIFLFFPLFWVLCFSN